MSKTLYEQDFQVWLATTISHLQKREFAALDTDNLIEELSKFGSHSNFTERANSLLPPIKQTGVYLQEIQEDEPLKQRFLSP